MENNNLAAQVEALAEDARDLAHSIRDDDNQPADRSRQRAHQLRQHMGIALVLAERLAQQKGNAEMLTTTDQRDGTGQVCYTIDLEPTEIAPVNSQ